MRPTRRALFVAAGAMIALGAPPFVDNAVEAASGSAFDFSFESIDGGPLALSDFAGRPLRVVNTASRCGFTHQYDALQALWSQYRDRGLVVLGVPSGDFRQELATAADVKEFCAVNFAIDFPMTDITSVTGPEAHPFFAWAAAQAGAPRWNFNKYLIAPDGSLIARYGSSTQPAALAAEIEGLLAGAGL